VLYNATCQIIATVAGVDADDSLQSAHTEKTWQRQRCSLRALSAVASIAGLGKVSLRGHTCRLHSKAAIQAGWRLRAQRDDETEWHEYVIRQARKGMHWVLTLEGT